MNNYLTFPYLSESRIFSSKAFDWSSSDHWKWHGFESHKSWGLWRKRLSRHRKFTIEAAFSVTKRSTRHRMRDLLTIMAYNAKTLVRHGPEPEDDVISRRADNYPYQRIPRKALISSNDPELALLGESILAYSRLNSWAVIGRKVWGKWNTLKRLRKAQMTWGLIHE